MLGRSASFRSVDHNCLTQRTILASDYLGIACVTYIFHLADHSQRGRPNFFQTAPARISSSSQVGRRLNSSPFFLISDSIAAITCTVSSKRISDDMVEGLAWRVVQWLPCRVDPRESCVWGDRCAFFAHRAEPRERFFPTVSYSCGPLHCQTSLLTELNVHEANRLARLRNLRARKSYGALPPE